MRFRAAHLDLRESARSAGSSPGSAGGWWRGGVTPRPMDEPASWADVALALHGHPGMEREQLCAGQPQAPEPGFGLPDLALPGEEHQHVPRLVADLRERPRHLVRDVLALVPGAVADLDRPGPALHLDDRGAVEERAQLPDLQGGRGHDDPQVRAPPQELVQVAEDEVDVEGALVRLVDDEGVVGQQVAVALGGCRFPAGYGSYPRLVPRRSLDGIAGRPATYARPQAPCGGHPTRGASKE